MSEFLAMAAIIFVVFWRLFCDDQSAAIGHWSGISRYLLDQQSNDKGQIWILYRMWQIWR